MAIHRVIARWSGFPGAPGYTNFFFTGDGAGGAAQESRLRAIGFFEALRSRIPADVEVLVEPEVAVIDELTGMTQEFIVATDAANPVLFTGAGGYSAPSGAVVTWNTAGVANGRRVRGRTFVVPLANTAYEDDGTLTFPALNDLRDAGAAMVGTGFDSGFGIWSRPRSGGGGGFYEVNSYRVADKAAVLRSRRD